MPTSHPSSRIPDRIEFVAFRTGTHTAMDGTVHEYTVADLDRIVERYNGQDAHEAPLVVGHPQDNDPAYGWVEKLTRRGEDLVVIARDLHPPFAEAVNAGRYKKRSISLYGDGLLRHVGFLGAKPPAVKGMPDLAAFAFSDDAGALSFEFAAAAGGSSFMDAPWLWRTLRRLMTGMREHIIETKDIETANRVLPAWDIENLEPPQPERLPQYSDPSHSPQEPLMDPHNPSAVPTPPVVPTPPATPPPATPDLAAQLAETQRRLEAAETRFAEAEAQRRRSEFEAYLDSDDMKRKVTPAMRPLVTELAMSLPVSGQTLSFSEGDETKQISPLDALKKVLASFSDQVEFREIATGGVTPPIGDGVADRIAKLANDATGRS